MIVALCARPPRLGWAEFALVVLVVLAGEVSIGLSNDAADAPRDRAAGRTDKPIATGQLGSRTAWAAAGVAVALSVGLGFLVSPVTGVVNTVMMAAGWGYNLGLKSTIWSAAAYLVGFGLIPAFAASTFPGSAAVHPWAFAVAALLGLGGHFANVLPDLEGDAATGVGGLPQRLAAAGRHGPTVVKWLAFGLLVTASVLLAWGQDGRNEWTVRAGLVAVFVMAGVGLRSPGRRPFYAALLIAVINVAVLLLGAPAIVPN